MAIDHKIELSIIDLMQLAEKRTIERTPKGERQSISLNKDVCVAGITNPGSFFNKWRVAVKFVAI